MDVVVDDATIWNLNRETMKAVMNWHTLHKRLIRGASVGVLAALMTTASGVALSATGADPVANAVTTGGPLSGCTSTTGVLVYIDFGNWPSGPESGGQDVGCAPTFKATQAAGGKTTGFSALNAAGFTTDGTSNYGQAFVCRLGVQSLGDASQEPAPAEQSCASTPGPDFWSYFHANAGSNTWSFSSGVQNAHPLAGSIDAWSYGNGSNKPWLTPDQVRAAQGTTTVSPALHVTSGTLKAAKVGKAYHGALSTSGGSAPDKYSLDVNSPALPSGLALSSTGAVSGTPRKSGTTTVIVDVKAAPISQADLTLTPPEGYTGPDLGTVALQVVVKAKASS
jgi:hypothetical protein